MGQRRRTGFSAVDVNDVPTPNQLRPSALSFCELRSPQRQNSPGTLRTPPSCRKCFTPLETIATACPRHRQRGASPPPLVLHLPSGANPEQDTALNDPHNTSKLSRELLKSYRLDAQELSERGRHRARAIVDSASGGPRATGPLLDHEGTRPPAELKAGVRGPIEHQATGGARSCEVSLREPRSARRNACSSARRR